MTNSIDNAYIVTNSSGEIIEISSAATERLNAPAHSIVGTPLIGRICRGDRRAFATELLLASNSEERACNLRLDTSAVALVGSSAIREDERLVGLMWKIGEPERVEGWKSFA